MLPYADAFRCFTCDNAVDNYECNNHAPDVFCPAGRNLRTWKIRNLIERSRKRPPFISKILEAAWEAQRFPISAFYMLIFELVFNPCGKSDLFVVHLNCDKLFCALQSLKREAKLRAKIKISRNLTGNLSSATISHLIKIKMDKKFVSLPAWVKSCG